MNSIITNILAWLTPYLPIVYFLLATIAVFVIAIFITKKFDISVIQTAKAIVDYIKQLLTDAKLNSTEFATLIRLLSQAVIYIIAIGTTTDSDARAAAGIQFIKELATEFGYTITDSEYLILQDILKFTFAMIVSLNLKVTYIKIENNKYTVKSVQKLQDRRIIMYKWHIS